MLIKINLDQTFPGFNSLRETVILREFINNYIPNSKFAKLVTLVAGKLVEINYIFPKYSFRYFKNLKCNLTQFINQPFLKFEFSYGSELNLHFGDRQPYLFPKLKERFKGSYIITTRASRWFLMIQESEATEVILDIDEEKMLPLHNLLQPLTEVEIEAQTYIKTGAKIKDVALIEVASEQNSNREVSSLGFCLVFENAYFLLIPDLTDQDEEDEDSIADWELFLPEHRYVRVGPGLKWSCSSSLDPAS